MRIHPLPFSLFPTGLYRSANAPAITISSGKDPSRVRVGCLHITGVLYQRRSECNNSCYCVRALRHRERGGLLTDGLLWPGSNGGALPPGVSDAAISPCWVLAPFFAELEAHNSKNLKIGRTIGGQFLATSSHFHPLPEGCLQKSKKPAEHLFMRVLRWWAGQDSNL